MEKASLFGFFRLHKTEMISLGFNGQHHQTEVQVGEG